MTQQQQCHSTVQKPTAIEQCSGLDSVHVRKRMTRLTCVTPTSSQGICKTHNIGTEHDTGPELAGDKGSKSPADEEPGNDVARCCVNCRNAEDEGGGKHQQESIGCTHTQD